MGNDGENEKFEFITLNIVRIHNKKYGIISLTNNEDDAEDSEIFYYLSEAENKDYIKFFKDLIKYLSEEKSEL